MDKYQGMYRVMATLTDNSDYSYFKHTKAAIKQDLEDKALDVRRGDIVYDNKDSSWRAGESTNNSSPLFRAREDCYAPAGDNTPNYDQIYGERDPYALGSGERDAYLLANSGSGQSSSHFSEGYHEAGANAEALLLRAKNTKRRGFFKGFAIRTLVAAALFLAVFATSKLDNPIAIRATDFIKNAVTYDLDANKDKELGEVRAVTLIKEALEESEDE